MAVGSEFNFRVPVRVQWVNHRLIGRRHHQVGMVDCLNYIISFYFSASCEAFRSPSSDCPYVRVADNQPEAYITAAEYLAREIHPSRNSTTQAGS